MICEAKSHRILGDAAIESGLPDRPSYGSYFAVMQYWKFLKRPGPPAIVTSCYFGYSIFHAACNGSVSTTLLKALSAEKLNGASDAFHACIAFKRRATVAHLKDSPTTDTKFLVSLEVLKQTFKVGLSERDIPVKVANVVIINVRE